jgi:large subunit ribosomal protein L30
MANVKQVKVTQVRSAIGRRADQQQTLVGLGIRRRLHSAILVDTPSVQGMIRKVRHLVTVEEINA